MTEPVGPQYIQNRPDLPGPPNDPNTFDVPPPRRVESAVEDADPVYVTETDWDEREAHEQTPLPHTPSQWEPDEEDPEDP